MEGNNAIIEVKPARAAPAGIPKDIEILSLFRLRVGYTRAIYLIYGDDIRDNFLVRIQKIPRVRQEVAPIEVWFHARPLEQAVRVGML